MLSFLAYASILTSQDYQARMIVLKEPNNQPNGLQIYYREEPLVDPKFSPKKFGDPAINWQFDWMASAFGPDPGAPNGQLRLRLRVFSQQKKPYEEDKTWRVARQAIRMWDFNHRRLKMDHPMTVNSGVVDFYLCFGGKAGAEQLLDEEPHPTNGQMFKVNTIYIYDLMSYTKPIEMAREIAHEYGHATLPAVGGFAQPEDWANGYLGEKLYLRWLRDEFAKGRMYTDDVMTASLADVDKWVKANVDPLVTKVAQTGPDMKLLSGQGQKAMDHYLGLVLYVDSLFPDSVLARSMKLIGSTKAKDYPEAVLMATEELPKMTITVPAYLKGKPLWLPMGKKAKVTGGKVVKRVGSWAQVQPTGTLVLVPEQS